MIHTASTTRALTSHSPRPTKSCSCAAVFPARLRASSTRGNSPTVPRRRRRRRPASYRYRRSRHLRKKNETRSLSYCCYRSCSFRVLFAVFTTPRGQVARVCTSREEHRNYSYKIIQSARIRPPRTRQREKSTRPKWQSSFHSTSGIGRWRLGENRARVS